MRSSLNTAVVVLGFLLSPLAQGKNILVVGDSLTCGPFGAQLVKRLSLVPGNSVALFCTVSSSPVHWLNGTNPSKGHGDKFLCNTCTGKSCTAWMESSEPDEGMMPLCSGNTGKVPKLTDLLKAQPYDQVIVALGTNTLPSTSTGSTYAALIKVITSTQKVSSCRWVGPPHFSDKTSESRDDEKNLAALYTSLNTVTTALHCPLIDSRPFTENPQPKDTVRDGIHRKAISGRPWGDKVAEIILAP